METIKSPLKSNYCRLPTKSRAEKLFDQIVTKNSLADVSNKLNLNNQGTCIDYSKKGRGKNKVDYNKESENCFNSDDSEDSFVKSKPKRRVRFVTYGSNNKKVDGNKEVKKRNCLRRKDLPKCTKEAVLEAFMKAGLPDYDAIASLPLNIVVMDNEKNKKEKKTFERISTKQIIKPFIPLVRKIDSHSKGADDITTTEVNPEINIESPSCIAQDNLDSVSFVENCKVTGAKEVSTPLLNSHTPPKWDLSCIQDKNAIQANYIKDATFATPRVPPPAKKRPWNVVNRRGTDILPPHPAIFDEPNIITNESVELSQDQPLDWSQVRSIAQMDESVHNVFSMETKAQLQKEIRESLSTSQANRPAEQGSISYYRRSIVETSKALHELGTSCRTIVREPPPRRSTRKRKDNLLETSGISFLVAFDKTYLEDVEKQIPMTTKEKVLALCEPPSITAFDKVLDRITIDSILKIGEGSYGEVFRSVNADEQEIVVKVVPLLVYSTLEEDSWAQILPELVISITFGDLRTGEKNRTPNFINTLKASCVSGSWPKELINAWEEYHKLKKSENQHPDTFGPNSTWLIILLANGGMEVEYYKFSSATSVLSVILQVALSLAAAEEEFEFEHRDLHTGNVLIAPCSEPYLEYRINGKEIVLPSTNVKVSVIDFTLARMSKDGYIVYDDLSKYEDIFTGEGDYQFEVYRLMRDANKNDWKKFTPYTNILWVHYLTLKLINDNTFKSRSKSHLAAMKVLRSLADSLLNFKSTTQFVQSPFFEEISSQLG